MIESIDTAPLIHGLLQALNAHDPGRVAQCYADDYQGLDVSRALLLRGRADVRKDLHAWFRAFPDVRFTVRETVAQPGRVALCWTAEGTHEGVFLHVPPTGRRVEACGFSLLTVEGGAIVRGLYLWDMAGLLRAMKLLPDLPGADPTTSQAELLARFLTSL